MNIKHFMAAILLLAGSAAQAQNKASLTEYFSKVLQGAPSVDAPRKNLSLRKVDEMRQTVWQAWCEANAASGEDGLPTLQPLSSSTRGSWHLPDSLEPSATMPFYYGCKGERPAAGYPLYIYLHGSGPKANEWSNGLYFGEHFKDAPSVYFIPQIPNEGEWYRWWQRSKQFAWERVLRQTLASGQVDANHLYVFGISEGGYGSQRLASFYADYWAAAGPMAGGEPLKNAPAENLSNIGFSLRTGAEDTGFYRNILSRYVAEELDSLENLYPTEFRHAVTLIPGQGHHIDYTQTTPWLSHFTRNPHPAHFMWEDYEMDGRHRSGFYNLLVSKRPDAARRTRYDYRVVKDSNLVDIVVENVDYRTIQTDPVYGIEMKFTRTYEPASGGAFTLFLSEDMLNLRLPVYVRVNGRKAFHATPKATLQSMLRSTAAFYDPERIFPVAIEVKY